MKSGLHNFELSLHQLKRNRAAVEFKRSGAIISHVPTMMKILYMLGLCHIGTSPFQSKRLPAKYNYSNEKLHSG